MLGVTRSVTLDITLFKCGQDPWKNDRCGADATGNIKRSDFGMTYGVPGVGDEIKFTFEIEAVKKK